MTLFPELPLGTIVKYTSERRDFVASVITTIVYDSTYKCQSYFVQVLYPLNNESTVGDMVVIWEDLCVNFEVIE